MGKQEDYGNLFGFSFRYLLDSPQFNERVSSWLEWEFHKEEEEERLESSPFAIVNAIIYFFSGVECSN